MSPRRTRGLGALALATLLGITPACDSRPGRFPFDWERMRDQPRYDAYGSSRFFSDGQAMRVPPPGTVPQDAESPEGGIAQARLLTVVPVDVDAALMTRGRNRYETFCAPCHALDGSAQSPVALNMQLRRPPSLLEERIRALPVGRIYQAITQGYGLMPSYAHQLSTRERWGVVAYVRALELSRSATLAALPPEVRAEAEQALGRRGPR